MNQVRVDQGILEGNQRNGVFRFRGIPFAAPPVGERRWAAPQPPAAWDGVRDATQFGNAAIQTVDTGVDLGAQPSEDCLYLNVWTASLDPQAPSTRDGLDSRRRLFDPTWLNLVFKSGADFGEGVAEVIG